MTPRLLILLAVLLLGWGCPADARRGSRWERAAEHVRAERHEMARREYMEILKSDPDDSEANECVGMIWLERGSPVRAATFLTRLRALGAASLKTRLHLARIRLSLGGIDEAREESLSLLQRFPDAPEALVLLTETVRTREDLVLAEDRLARWSDKTSAAILLAAANLAACRGDGEATRSLLQRAIARDLTAVEPRLALAAFLAGQGLRGEAREAFRRALEVAPRHAEAGFRLAGFLSQIGARDEAVAQLELLTRQRPEYLPAWRGLAEIATAERRFADAELHLRRIAAVDPDDYEARLLQARAWLAQGETARAIAELERFGRDFPGLGMEKHQLALAYLQRGDGARAKEALREVVTRNPDNADALHLLAQLHLRGGAAGSAFDLLRSLVDRRPAYLPAYLLLVDAARAAGRLSETVPALERGVAFVPRLADLRQLLGRTQLELARPDEARATFEAVLRLAPGHAEAIAARVEVDLLAGNPAAALERAREEAERAPRSPAVRVALARVHRARADGAAAFTALLEALAIDPGHAPAYSLLAETFAADGDDPGTDARVDELLERFRRHDLAVVVAGEYFASRGRIEQARSLYLHHLEGRPESGPVLNSLAALQYGGFSDLGGALATALRARQAAPASPAVADTLGWLLFLHARYDEALPLLAEAVAKLGHVPEVNFHWGMIQSRTGNLAAARAALRAAISVPGNHGWQEDARRELAAIEREGASRGP